MSKTNMALMLCLICSAAYMYHTLTNVHHGDVAAYHNLPQQLRGLLVKAGDVVALTSDGQNPERICRFADGDDLIDTNSTRAEYVNGLGKHLPSFTSLFSSIMAGVGLGGEQAEPDRIRFVGKLSIVRDEMPSALSPACECSMAERLARQERVCTALAALSGASDKYARAVRFARYSNFPARETFEACGLVYSAEIENAMTGQRCDQFSSLPWDAAMRHSLKLIEQSALAVEHAGNAPSR